MRTAMRGFFAVGLPALALMFLSPSAPAQPPEQGARAACRADVEKLCKDVQPGQGRIAQCLKQNQAEVSPGCKQAMAQMHDKMQAFMEACGDDTKQYCQDVKPGHGRILKCLKQNEAKLSEGCRTTMQGAHGSGDQK